MSKPTIYLAGPMYGCSNEEASGWRDFATRILSPYYNTLNPMSRDYRGREGDFAAEIVANDLIDIDNSEILLVNAPIKIGWGTPMEVFYANQKGKRIVAFATEVSPWLRHHATEIHPTLDAALYALIGVQNAQS